MEELEELRQKLVAKKEELQSLKEKNAKNKKVRKKKTISLIARIAIPTLFITGAVVGCVRLVGGGYPFVVDNFPAYERYSIESTYDGITTETEDYSYEKRENPILEVYFPFEEEEENRYSRYVRTYSLDVKNNEELYNAIKNKDLDYFVNNLKKINEKKEIRPEIKDDNESRIVASFSYLSKNYVCEVPETIDINTKITIIEIMAVIIFSLFASMDPILSFTDKIKEIKNSTPIKSDKSLTEEIASIQSSISEIEGGMHHAK